MQYRFETNWYALRDYRLSLVSNVVSKRNSKARRQAAMEKLQTLAAHAGVFATLAVNNTVQNNEKQYQRWLRGENIVGLDIHVNAPINVQAWIVGGMDIALFSDLSGWTFTTAAMNTRGLGSAKATFMGALMGFDMCPCIDTHMFKMLQKKGVTTTKGVPGSMSGYRKLMLASGWTHTLDQWHAFLTVPHYAKVQHDPYFYGVLGKQANVLYAG